MDRYIRGKVRNHLGHDKSMNNAILRAYKKDGGRGLWSIKDRQYIVLLSAWLTYEMNNADSCGHPAIHARLNDWRDGKAQGHTQQTWNDVLGYPTKPKEFAMFVRRKWKCDVRILGCE